MTLRTPLSAVFLLCLIGCDYASSEDADTLSSEINALKDAVDRQDAELESQAALIEALQSDNDTLQTQVDALSGLQRCRQFWQPENCAFATYSRGNGSFFCAFWRFFRLAGESGWLAQGPVVFNGSGILSQQQLI